MERYSVIIEPKSPFGTELKGDTLFGHFCWQAAYDESLLNGGLNKQIAAYPENPFAVFSSAFPVFEGENSQPLYALKRPEMPISCFIKQNNDKAEDIKQKKAFKKKRWMVVRGELGRSIMPHEFVDDKELIELCLAQLPDEEQRRLAKVSELQPVKRFLQPHNTINRLTQTTGSNAFAPYVTENHHFLPKIRLVVIICLNPSATDIDRISTAMKRIGEWGFGRDASTGLGRFSVLEINELPFEPPDKGTGCYTLAPCVPQQKTFNSFFFQPFIRYGKHGDRLANYGSPFKAPVIMADEASVFFTEDENCLGKPYIGQAVKEVSRAMPETVVQGYAPYLSLRLEN